MLEIHTKAPLFSAIDQEGNTRQLTEFLGKYVVLYFYPKDDTPGCTKEACSLRDNYEQLRERAVVIGVSTDSVQSHKKFAEKFHLPFILLSDPQKEIISRYKAEGISFTKRITYLINPEGAIEEVFPKVNPSHHAEELLIALGKRT